MNRVFDFNRFSKVMVYDLRRVYQNYGITAIILLLMPVIYCFFYGMLPLIFGNGWQTAEQYSRIPVFIVSMAALVLSFPVTVYGKITDRKEGTNFLTLPASTFEKFLSMVLITGVIAPILFMVGFLGVDSIISALGLFRGGSLFSLIQESKIMNNDYVTLNLWHAGFLGLAFNMLTFTLGSIYFKKAKVGKTILSLFAINLILSFIMVPFVSNAIEGSHALLLTNGDIENWIESHAQNAELWINLVLDFARVVEFAVLASLIYLRVKTLKH